MLKKDKNFSWTERLLFILQNLMFTKDINYEKYRLLRKNIRTHANNRIHLEVSDFMSLLKQYHTMIQYTNIQKLPNQQEAKKLEKGAKKLRIPSIIPITYVLFDG